MKLKKGSKEARDFMAKIRAKKSLGAVKKRQMPKQNKKEIGTRKFQNNTEMVLKGYDHNGNELWVTAKYYDKPKMNERKKNKNSTLKGNKHTDNKSHNYKINISGLDFFEKNRLEYNKYDHLTIYRNYRGRDSAKLNNKVIALKKAYNLIDKGEYKFYNQINLGSMLAVQYRKLK